MVCTLVTVAFEQILKSVLQQYAAGVSVFVAAEAVQTVVVYFKSIGVTTYRCHITLVFVIVKTFDQSVRTLLTNITHTYELY